MKQDKWSKLMSVNDNALMLTKFLEKGDSQVLLISLSSAGTLQCATVFPSSFRNKTVYFVKRYGMHYLILLIANGRIFLCICFSFSFTACVTNSDH